MSEKLIVSWEEYCKIVEKLAIQIDESGYKPDILLGVMIGAGLCIDLLSRIFKLPTAYIAIQSYSGKGMEDKQVKLIFAREISSIAGNNKFKKLVLVDDLSDTGLTLNKTIEWLKTYGPIKDYIKEIKTACLWKKSKSTFEPDFCSVRLNTSPWLLQPFEHPFEELTIEDVKKRQNKKGPE